MNESQSFQPGSVVQDPHFIDIRSKVDNLEFELNNLCEELGKNVKEFEVCLCVSLARYSGKEAGLGYSRSVAGRH